MNFGSFARAGDDLKLIELAGEVADRLSPGGGAEQAVRLRDDIVLGLEPIRSAISSSVASGVEFVRKYDSRVAISLLVYCQNPLPPLAEPTLQPVEEARRQEQALHSGAHALVGVTQARGDVRDQRGVACDLRRVSG